MHYDQLSQKENFLDFKQFEIKHIFPLKKKKKKKLYIWASITTAVAMLQSISQQFDGWLVCVQQPVLYKAKGISGYILMNHIKE